MKTLYINLNNEEIQRDNDLEILPCNLDDVILYHLGKKIAGGCEIKNETALITDFNSPDNKEDYQHIIVQLNELKTRLFSEMCDGVFDFKLPDGYIHWLRFNINYNHIYESYFSQKESRSISINLNDLYNKSIEKYFCGFIIRSLKRNNLYNDIDTLVFNDMAITRKSPIIATIKEAYKNIRFLTYKEWTEKKRNIINQEINIPGTVKTNNDIDLIVNWICDEFQEIESIDWRKDKDMIDKIYKIVEQVYNRDALSLPTYIEIPYTKYDSHGKPIHTTRFSKLLTSGVVYLLKHPYEVEDPSWGWEFVRSLGELDLKKYNGKYGLVGYGGVILLPCEYTEIAILKSGYFRPNKNGKYGLVNTDKTVNIPCIYDDLYECDNDLFHVRIGFNHYKINCYGHKKYIKCGRNWILYKDTSILDRKPDFPICGVVIGYTNIEQLDCKYTHNININKQGVDIPAKIYNVNGEEDIIFFQFDSDEHISIARILSTSKEYYKIQTTIQHLSYTPILENEACSIYQAPDKIVKIYISSEYIIIEHSSAKIKLISELLVSS